MSHGLTFSRAWMALGAIHDPPTACLWWARPEVNRFDTSGRPARIGSLVHLLAESHLTGCDVAMNDLEPDEVAEAMALFNGPLREWLEQFRGGYIELGVRYDSEQDIAEEGPRRGQDGYGQHQSHLISGTLDLARAEDGVAYVVDIKSGAKGNCHPEQLWLQGLAFSRLPVARTMGVKEVRVAFAFARKQRMPAVEYEVMDADRLDEVAGQVRKALRLLPTSQPLRGDYCFYCPARSGCPEWQQGPVAA